MQPGIRVIIHAGQYGDRVHEIVLPLDERLLRELSEPMELSDDPLALMLAGGWHGRDVVNVRKRVFKMREGTAKQIAAAIVRAMTDYFGRNDKTKGYSHEENRAFFGEKP